MAKSKTSFETANPQWDRLQTTLVNSGTQTKNNALYQTIFGLITASATFQNDTIKKLQEILGLLGSGNLPANSLLGRGNVGAGSVQNITVDETLVFDGTVLGVAKQGDWDIVKLKLNSQDVVNDTTLTDDEDLFIDVNEFDVWYIRILLLYAANNAGADYKFNFDFPTVNGWIRYIVDNDLASAIQVSTGIRLAAAVNITTVTCGTDGALTPRMAEIEMMIRAGATGTVQFQFANNTAGADFTSRTYAGSVLQARLLSGIPIGQIDGIGGGGPSGGSGPGAGSDPPTVPFPNDIGVVIAYNVANPGQITQTEENYDFMNGVIADLQAVSARYGLNYKRNGPDVSTDIADYYHGDGAVPPAERDPNVYVIDIVSNAGLPIADVAWINVTTPAARGSYFLGPA